ncbi:S41 family peptidase [Flavobacterium sp. 1355]|uniref:S41 family peptidase n=1 Tax=Flavobacterium sp. 1355 TaxID=2806571 RepID=UPI001AE25F56|nr:S41 family peptidase [Flavobacterium sp. 1355]MBP1222428.1 C-terminal processing protease CtpA/Prc [Flavobacterium sp. 1355]
MFEFTNKYHFTIKSCLLIVFTFFVSCQNDDSPVEYDKGTNQYVNNWMYEQMKKYYLWNETIPENTDLALNPKIYFDQLLHKDDRFSYALNILLPETSPKSIRNNYGFDVSFIEFENKAYAVILYVLNDSPAERSGLKRGQFIKSINGVLVNNQNYENLHADLASTDKTVLEVQEYSSVSGFSTAKQIEINRGFTFSQPVKYHVINQNGEKVGYIEIPHFDIGLAGIFLQIFNEFKNQSVTKIVIDLRYNGGGDVSSAAALSTILAPNIKSGDLFIVFKGNKNGGLVHKTFAEALEMNELQVSFEQLRAVHPPIQEVYVLCGSHTASASEIILNNLKPFMNVISIGEKTVGKDAAGFEIKDDRTPDQPGWILYPIIYKLFNANNEGDYTLGINPSVQLNELQEMEIFPMGNPEETLLSRALNGTINSKKKQIFIKELPLKSIYNNADPFVLIKNEFE